MGRERLLAAAAQAIKRHGEKVPMASIAHDARVGIGTLYRHYPDRADLLAALERRSYEIVLATRAPPSTTAGLPSRRSGSSWSARSARDTT
jgi:AcrR family transcriptional regulator